MIGPRVTGPPPDGRNETPLERCDRNLAELMQEVRVAQMGVQVLFGFLLTVPFTNRFEDVTGFQVATYFATLLVAGAAVILLIAPSAWHRILFRCGDKEHLVIVANQLALAGLLAVALAMVGVVLLVSDVLFGAGPAFATAAGALIGCVVLWYVLPLNRRHKLAAKDEHQREPSPNGARTVLRVTRAGTGR
jgi:amino acid transporter